MDFSFTEDQEALRQLARTDLRRSLHARAAEGGRGDAGVVRPRRCGASWRRPTCSASRCRRTSAAAGSASSSSCILLEEVGRAVAPVPLWPTLVLGALPIDLFGSDGAAPAAAAGRRRAARRSSPRRWSRTAATSPAIGDRDGAARRQPAGGSTASRPACRPRTWRRASSSRRAPATRRAGVFLVDPQRRRRAARAQIHDQRRAAVRADARAAPRSAPTTCSAIRPAAARSSTGPLQRAVAALCAIERRRRRRAPCA